MVLPVPKPVEDRVVCVNSVATFTAGFTVAVPAPIRGEIVAIYLAPLDGGALGGSSATLTVSVQNTSVGTLTCATVAAGFATGGDTAFSPRAFVQVGDAIKLVLATNLTNANNAAITVVIRERTI